MKQEKKQHNLGNTCTHTHTHTTSIFPSGTGPPLMQTGPKPRKLDHSRDRKMFVTESSAEDKLISEMWWTKSSISATTFNWKYRKLNLIHKCDRFFKFILEMILSFISRQGWRPQCEFCSLNGEQISQLSPYVFAVFFVAARLRAKIEPSHRAVLPAWQKRVGVIWYRHNLTKNRTGGGGGGWRLRFKKILKTAQVLCHVDISPVQYLISCPIVTGELALSVELRTLLSVGVVDDAVSRAGDDLLIVGVRHELRTEDVCPMTWTYGLLNLETSKYQTVC